MSEIFVAGSAGFIGSNITNYLIQNHPKISVASLDNLQSTGLERLMPSIQSKNRHTFYLADLKDQKIVSKAVALEQPTTAIYCAFTPSISPLENVVNALGFLDATKDIIKKVIFTGSIAENPTFWGALERILIEAIKAVPWVDLIQWAFLKVMNLFGPRQRSDADAALSRLLKDIFAGKPVDKLPDDQYDWVYVKDYFNNVMKFVEKDHFESGVYQVSSGNVASMQSIHSFLNKLIYDSQRELIVRGASNTDVDSMEWVAPRPLEEAIEHTAAWYDANKWIWK